MLQNGGINRFLPQRIEKLIGPKIENIDLRIDFFRIDPVLKLRLVQDRPN